MKKKNNQITAEKREKKPKTAKKTDFRTAKNAVFIFEELASGKSLRTICTINKWKLTTTYEWLQKEYSEQYARARELQTEFFVDEIKEIADDSAGDWVQDDKGNFKVDNEAIQRSKLKIEARKWIASRLLPKKYGDRVELEHKGAVDVNVMPTVTIGDVELIVNIGEEIEETER